MDTFDSSLLTHQIAGEAWEGHGVRGRELNRSPSVVRYGRGQGSLNTSAYGSQVGYSPSHELQSPLCRPDYWHDLTLQDATCSDMSSAD